MSEHGVIPTKWPFGPVDLMGYPTKRGPQISYDFFWNRAQEDLGKASILPLKMG
jgi:hypothetical protein